MSEKVGNFFMIGFIGIIILSIMTPSCNKEDRYNVNVQTTVSAADGLDLKSVGELLKKSSSTNDFEKLLNSSSEGVNNLDLNEDGKVDYIKVTEYGKGNIRGYSLTVEPAKGEEQEIATIEVEKEANGQGSMQMHGNENIYGSGHYYHSRFSFGDYMLMSYLWGPRWGYWHSPYRYGYYPSYYRSYRPVSRSTYTSRTRVRTSNSSLKSSSSSSIKSSTRSPNASKSAKSIKAPLKKPTTSQKSFQSRNPSKSVKSGGFGRSKSSSSRSYSSSSSSRSYSSRSSSVRSSSRSGGFFGGK